MKFVAWPRNVFSYSADSTNLNNPPANYNVRYTSDTSNRKQFRLQLRKNEEEMKVITRELLRKRAEHNEGMISTLEELSLHQEELLNINEVLGATCRKLKILYLQNNCISKMENLVHLKELVYLNMALNNVEKIEGLQNCENLAKLDLTANFVDVDTLEDSINHLSTREQLGELYLMGNPCQANWKGFESYVIGKIPQLKTLDGKEITRSMQITARQLLPSLENELRILANQKRTEKEKKRLEKSVKGSVTEVSADSKSGDDTAVVECVDVEDDEEADDGISDRDKLTENTPETRYEIYKELGEQKKEKEDREKAMRPRERNYEEEHVTSVSTVREKEAHLQESEIKQKNEGGWNFKWDEESKPGFVLLEVEISRFLDSSLIDVDVHPTYISAVIKSKMLRLRTPAEVKAGESKCQRSKTTGSLLVIMPKVNPRENAISIRADTKARSSAAPVTTLQPSNMKPSKSGTKVASTIPKKLTLQQQMMAEAMAARGVGQPLASDDGSASAISSAAVDFRNIVKHKDRTSDSDSVDRGSINQVALPSSLVAEVLLPTPPSLQQRESVSVAGSLVDSPINCID